MAGPCKVIYKGEEMPYEKFLAMLHDGLLDKLVKDEVIDDTKFSDPTWSLNQQVKDGTITAEQRDAFLATEAEQREPIVKDLESKSEDAEKLGKEEEILSEADRIVADATGELGAAAPKPGEVKAAPAEERPKITSGPSTKALKKLAEDLGFEEPLKGEVLSAEEYVKIGQEMIKAGADAEKVRADFEKSGTVSAETISVARAYQEKLVKEASEARRKFGKDRAEFKAAKDKVEEWVKNVMKPMASEWGRGGRSLQGLTDADVGSFESMERSYEERTDKKFTEEQAKQAEQYEKEFNELNDKNAELEEKLKELIRKGAEKAQKPTKEKEATIKERTQKLADFIRKGKLSRPDVFSAATPASLVWDGALEAAARTVEAGGTVADAIAKGLEHIRSTEWFQSAKKDVQAKVEKAYNDYFQDAPKAKTAGEKRIDQIQRRIDDIRAGKVKEAKEVKYTPEEQAEIDRLTSELEDLKKERGMYTTKPLPEAPKTEAEKLGDFQEELQDRFQDKTDNKFDPEDAADVWDYAKRKYIDKDYSIEDTFQNTANDLGLTPDQVRSAFASDKSVKTITDEMYKTQNKRKLVERAAKAWLKSTGDPKVKKFLGSLPDLYFGLKTLGHGTVGAQTHAGLNIFKPSQWKQYWPFFFNQFKYAYGDKAKYEQAMTDLENHPDFLFWKRAGLAVDPNVLYTEYENLGRKFQTISQIGERGFNALKPYRLSLAKAMYDGLSDVEKADKKTAKMIAELVNNSTGTTTTVNPGAWTGAVFFAPKLEISRWKRIITNPAKAANTFVNWKKATPAEKVAAKYTAKNAGEIIAVYSALLAANAALNAYAGDDKDENKVNLTDPLSPDFLKFKAGGKTIDLSGGILSTMRFIATLINQSRVAYSAIAAKEQGRRTPQEVDYMNIMKQLRGKASPFSGLAADLLTGVNGIGKPLPFSEVKPRKGEEAYTYPEFLGEQFTPIPVAEGLRTTIESMHKKGMSDADIMDVLNGIAVGSISGFTGAKIQFAPEGKKKLRGQ